MEKMFRIGEISRLYHIGADSLRYYEKLGVITPHRSESGYRLYSVQDIWRLNVIRELLSLGFHMNDIKEYLNCHTLSSTIELLEKEQTAIQDEIARLRQLQKNVEKRMHTILSAQQAPVGEIVLEQQPPRRCFTIAQGYEEEHEMDVLIQQLLNKDKERFYVIGNNQIGTVVKLQDDSLSYESVFIMDEAGPTAIPAGPYLSVRYRGDYGQSLDWGRQLLRYAAQHGFAPAGPLLELLWIDVHATSRVEEQVTELQLLVKAAAE